MRPHKLVLKAFGPFAKETVIDFDAMGNSIYLISGNTGAGKTTIFDGIIYALYGTASGGARSGLGTEAFHSDYAKDGGHRDEMRVELEFSNAGRTFSVVRRMNWGKKGNSGTINKESTLSENKNTLVNGKGREDKDDVTQKVTEILGLDADQFRRIIMLAQGEFQKFLTEKDDKRGEILGKLYDNRRHRDFQLRLNAASALLQEQDKALIGDETAQLKVLIQPDDIDDDVCALLAVDHPELLLAVQHIIDEMDEKCKKLNKDIAEKDDALNKLKDSRTRAKSNNDLLDALEAKKAQLLQKDAQKKRMALLRDLVRMAEAAERVLPSENAVKKAESEWERSLEQIRSLEEEKDQLAEKVVFLKKDADETEKTNKPAIAALNKKSSAIEAVLPLYDKLVESQTEYNQINGKLKVAEQAAAAAQAALEKQQKRQRELTEKLNELAEAGEATVTVAERQKQDLSDRQQKLEDLRSKIGEVKTLIAEEASCKAALQTAGTAALAAEKEHLLLNEAFLLGQAGVLAQDMREKLQSEEEVFCPVCGVRHTAADAASFAVCHEDVPTKEVVEQAFAAWNEARQTAQEAVIAYNNKQKELQQKKDAALELAQELLSVADWTVLADNEVISDALADCAAKYSEAQTVYLKAVTDRDTKAKVTVEKEAVDNAIGPAEKDLAEATDRLNSAKNEATSARTRMQNFEQQLKEYPESKTEAKAQIDSLTKQANDLQKAIDDKKEAYHNCLLAQEKNSGNLENARSEEEVRKNEEEKAKSDFKERLKECTFSDVEAYQKALSPEGTLLDEKTLSEWLLLQKSTIETYDNDRRDLDASIRQLRESTKGMERVDLAALSKQIDEAEEQLETLRKETGALSSDLQTDRTVFQSLATIRQKREKNRKVFGELIPLSETANGKYAFSRYVLKGFFERIVEQANLHLDIMTDGEYRLVPTQDGDGRSNLGLGLKVLNTITNLERETATLSGGQLFEASLSLALGLSDVVQMESASTVQIDSMFIDEGFGSLDGGRLDKALEVLQHLSGGKRQIGIISHVARLDECLPRKIHVIAGDAGSTVRIETDA